MARRKNKTKATGGYTKPVETEVGISTPETIVPKQVWTTLSPPATTKRLVYNKMPINRYTKFKCEGFTFGFDSNLDPVPVEVPSLRADALLQMMDNGCRCHNGKPVKLFREV